MDRHHIILGISITILIIMGFVVMSGCSCFKMEKFEYESFENEGKLKLTKEEQELFDNITKGNLSEKDVKELMSSNVITEHLVSKFLDKLDSMPERKEEPEDKPEPPAPKKKEAPKKEAFSDTVEPFCGDMPYADF